ncbi:MAG TPA: LLM class F420-dependent oxidoreductase [Streptosporangiaceae bacterium]|nr:LLM class F420-dependent oxidoreductase [Streptosporangiaceae bacterium]
MRISLNITNYSWPGGPAEISTQLGRIIRAADEGGVDTAWVADHLIQADPNSTPDAEMYEAYTTLGFLAGQTQRIRLGTMVTCATYREPAVLVKMVTTLDVLSGGRAWLGVGAGYHQEEARSMGLLLPPVAERFERLEETLRIALHMWSEDDASPFKSAHHHLEGPITSPKPLHRPHPPILVGGMGERKTLRLVAQYADACNLFDIPDGGRTMKRKLSVLAAHCEETGRPYEEIEKTLSTRLCPDESAGSLIERCVGLAEHGIQHVVLITAAPWTEEGVATIAAAIPALREVSA